MKGSFILERLKELAQQAPQDEVSLILRTKIDPSQAARSLAGTRVRVERTFKLIPALVVQGLPADLLELASQPWVESLEEDREVKAL